MERENEQNKPTSITPEEVLRMNLECSSQTESFTNITKSPMEENTFDNRNLKSRKWTQEEDEKLKALVETYGNKNWKTIAEEIKTRTSVQCLHRWSKILKPGLVKGPWTIEEDKKLIEWVKNHGPAKWSQCSRVIDGRSGKQCRERWFNALNPAVIKGQWTPADDYKIFKLYSIFGSKWSKIALHFKSRSENSIKNRFYSTLRRYALCAKKKSRHNSNEEIALNENSNENILCFFKLAFEEKTKEYENYIKYNPSATLTDDDFKIIAETATPLSSKTMSSTSLFNYIDNNNMNMNMNMNMSAVQDNNNNKAGVIINSQTDGGVGTNGVSGNGIPFTNSAQFIPTLINGVQQGNNQLNYEIQHTFGLITQLTILEQALNAAKLQLLKDSTNGQNKTFNPISFVSVPNTAFKVSPNILQTKKN